jgi:hypothetical protein
MNTLVAKRYPGKTWEICLVKDWMIAKFYLPYTITVPTKRWMQRLAIVRASDEILDKCHGKYCPKADRWGVETSANIDGEEIWLE